MTLVARVTDYTGEHITLHVHGLGTPGERPLLGQLIIHAGSEWTEIATALLRGGVSIIDACGLLQDTPYAISEADVEAAI